MNSYYGYSALGDVVGGGKVAKGMVGHALDLAIMVGESIYWINNWEQCKKCIVKLLNKI